MMRPLDTQTFPLQGVQLIEASAGTGKTYTIANLYLRLVLECQLPVPQILVVTFTKAATQELRARIRARLHEARQRLLSGAVCDDGDLGSLVLRATSGVVAQGTRLDAAAATALLDAALTHMDEAAVYTIHGFAQRMLTDHAFESGAPFEAELLGDEQNLRRAAVEDFWRRRFYGAPEDDVAWASAEWGTPEGLYRQIAALLGRDAARLLPEDIADIVQTLATRWATLRTGLIDAWAAEGEAACEQLRASPALNRNRYRAASVMRAIDALADWLGGNPSQGELPERIDLFTPAKLTLATKKGHDTPSGPLFDLCAELEALAPRLARARRAVLLREAVCFTREAVATHKRARRLLAYDDLLSQLDAVLSGEDGAALAERIRARFPIAMIDEFQDTDPLQYRIFSAVYAVADAAQPAETASTQPASGERAECARANALFMIGDPKQAIYGFRGADIFAYFKAQREAGEHAYTLTTNWRSGSALIDAINRLFGACERPFVFEEIGFHPVQASITADATPLLLNGVAPPPLMCWWLGHDAKPPRPSALMPSVAAACAHEIARLLACAEAGDACLGDRPLVARDLAVLVRDRVEARIVRTALAHAGIASVFLTRDSIFATAEAEALRRLLRAVAEPGDARALRAALATDLIGANATALEALNHDEATWESWLGHFQRAQMHWREHGFMAMFTQLLGDCAIAHRLLAEPDGERRMTNLLQLGELLAVAAGERSGFESLLRWLDARIADPDGEDEAQQLRLESDESLVQVVTIHASKGLEYPLVFLPFPWRVRAIDPDKANDDGKPFLFHAQEDETLCADLGSEARVAHAKRAEQERLAEDLRLLYVALTRARQRLYLSWGAVAGAEQSALAWLLHGGVGMIGQDEAAIRADLFRLNAGGERLELRELPSDRAVPLPPVDAAVRRARRFAGRVDAGWRVTSYSGLVADHGTRPELPDYDAVALDEVSSNPPARTVRDAFAFPRGARAGLFLHALLERLDFPQAQGEILAQAVRAGLQLHGFAADWQPAIEALVRQVLDTPLDDAGLRLRDIARTDRRDELAFYYPFAPLSSRALNTLLARRGSLALDGAGLSFNPLRGMMKGFIDLVFRRDGRYYLADYKSNHLGDRAEDYAQGNLAEAMREHRYDLQYLIYCVALHRHLRARLPGYDYARDFGGVFYLFLRGMRPADGPRLGVYHDRPESGLIDALDALFTGEAGGA
ncbi:exodeoxyribonuclease V subunit beta [Acidihalobacter yilgarnensis]|uniref:RecBCD enzyme subunit RecB n=1 Tax=Acidihalobacter yilgarnensis TaxID=2819280 RepID=A0A1D8IRF3_9GAMM|nr:exodeoxyribonuclease V subunit beta [Acidihalobacter yilgarnensis]AOU99080.1 exodeoxyribonuclease V subunit beta [Acidihalobacter yilgarnensis]